MLNGVNWEKFQGKQIGILGAGKENISLVPYLIKAGALVTLCEHVAQPEAVERLEKIPNIQLRLGADCLSEISDFDIIFRTPGMPISQLDQALAGKKELPERTSAVDLFLEYFGDQTIGVTGTKGKGTTSTMIASILTAANRPVLIAGNIGNSIFESLEQITEQTLIVMELSSFQLEDVRHSPKYAVLLPVTEEHLQPLSERSPNYHRSLEDYVEAKRRLVAFQQKNDTVVYASDSKTTATIAKTSAGVVYGVGKKGPDGIIKDGNLKIKESTINFSETGISGDHLFLDAALAGFMAKSLGVTDAAVAQGIKDFVPLHHRMQKVGVFRGITFIDDSYATAPDATIAALSAFEGPIILLAGGSRKGVDFSELANVISKSKVKAVVLIGQEAERISETLKKAKYAGKIHSETSLESAVKKILSLALEGDVVLLSPACASKDMFIDAADRGEQFSKLTAQLFA